MDFQVRYLPLKKLVIALVITTRKLMQYFQVHLTAVYTEFSLKNMLMKADLSGKLSQWVIELGCFDIKFLLRPRSCLILLPSSHLEL